MSVRIEHHIDASEPQPDGSYSFYYEYDLYYFDNNSESILVARSYMNTPTEVSFLSKSKSTVDGEEIEFLSESDFKTPLLIEAIQYLRDLGKTQCKWLKKNSRKGYVKCPIC
ncbi:hypothetical protein [uncultured Thiothrix sp.]|uniref:hypothetical protein n=1 Tax=uncultured Thiothrix sp. TaxID=223185 RepID=UPI0026269783|nr:hypothetical protein [uncultured Thiothrix sp.]